MMTEAVARRMPLRPWPMTSEALKRLIDEISQLRQDVSTLAGNGLEEGVVRLPIAQATRRLETLAGVLEGAAVADDDGCVAIGRPVRLRDGTGETMEYAVVFPGDGDPTRGWISADSPLGAAILGATAGTTVEVDAPVGRWSVTVLDVG